LSRRFEYNGEEAPQAATSYMATFFSFDGIDGVGKSTQLKLFCQWLADQGRPPVVCRDPGSTPLGEKVRGLVLESDDSTPIDARAEMLLYMAARAQLVDEIIRPALAAGRTVVSDRFLLANVVYQGYGGGLDPQTIRRVGAVATDGVAPDCTFLLDLPAEAALARVGRQLDRVESRGAAYLERLREGFLAEAKAGGAAIHVIDAGRDVDAIQAEIRRLAARALSSETTGPPPA
jgi:dTMP kinase